jgi:hypothetical protein
MLKPYSYFCLDLETYNASPEAADRWMASCWRPDSIGTWKCDTVAKRLQEMFEKKRQQLALLEEAPVIVITIKSDTEFRCLHCLEAHDPKLMDGATVQGFTSEAEMLMALRNLLNAVVVLPDGNNSLGAAMVDAMGAKLPPTEFVGHNIRDFDLPKLRTAFLCNDVQLPRALVVDLPMFDTMQVFCRRFGLNTNGFIGLDAILQIIGLEGHKHLVDGAQIPGLVEAREFSKIITYALLDVADSENIYLRMIGRHPALK